MTGRSEPRRLSLPRTAILLLATLALVGCAAQRAYQEGTASLQQGQIATGLTKLQEAVTLEPKSVKYRMALIRAKEDVIRTSLDQANALLTAHQHDAAEAQYKKALMVDGSNERALAGLREIDTYRRHLTHLAEAKAAWERDAKDEAQNKVRTILTENPNHEGARQLQRAIDTKEERAAPPTALAAAYKKPLTIEFKDAPLKTIFEVISRTSGLNFIFDKDIRTDQRTSIFLKNSTVEAAVNVMLLTNQLEQRVLDGNTLLLYPRTAAKQKDYQPLSIKSFYLTNAEAKNVAATLKTLLKSQDVVVDEKLNMLLIKDSPEVIRLAEKLVDLHDVPEPEVMMEVEILEVKRSKLLDLGVRWPEKVDFSPLPKVSGGILTVEDLRNIGADRIGVTISPASVSIQKQDTDANILANPRIRSRNREKARVLIGERVPNITTTSTSTGFVSESVNYVDVGLKLDVEPIIYPNNEVAIRAALEVSSIVRQIQTKSGTLAFQIGTRTATSVLRLKDGENQVLAGLINDEDRKTANKIPGLGDLPLVGRLFGSQTNDGSKTEIVLSITPHVLRNIPRPSATQAEFAIGTDSSMRSNGSLGTITTPTPSPAPPVPREQETASQPAAEGLAPKPSIPTPVYPSGAEAVTTEPNPEPGITPAGQAALRWQGPSQLKAGDTFSVQLIMQSDLPIVSLPMAVGFDPQVLQVTGVLEGDFLKQGGVPTKFTSRVDPSGHILMTSTRSGESGATQLNSIATISFRAIATSPDAKVQLLTIAPIGVSGIAVNTPLPQPKTLTIEP